MAETVKKVKKKLKISKNFSFAELFLLPNCGKTIKF